MYPKQTKRLKWQKIALVGLMTLVTLVTLVIPSFAATAGVGGDNYPEIPLYLELKFNDGSAEFMNITDRYYLSDRVLGSTTQISGHSNIVIKPVGTNVQSDYVFNRKSISTNANGYSVIGFNLTAPAFFLTVNGSKDGFNQQVGRFKIPNYSNVTGTITYDIYCGGSEKVATVTRDVVSPIGISNDYMMFTYTEISNAIGNYAWSSCRIDNWKFTTTSYTFSQQSSADPSVLSGTWVLDEDIYPAISGSDESYVNLYFNFSSNGRNFIGMTFGDTVELLYMDYNGVNYGSVMVWDTSGWINNEYRTITVSDGVNWSNVVADELNPSVNGGDALKSWLQSYATKTNSSSTSDSSGAIFEYLYSTKTMNYMQDAMNTYFVEWSGNATDGDAYQKGYDRGYGDGKDDGERIGYQKGISESNPDLTSWLSVATNGIFNFKLLPFLTIGDLLGIIITIALVIALLKFFAGG